MKSTCVAFLLVAMLIFSGCSRHEIKTYQETKPVMDIKEYFTGPIKAWGIVQNRKGEVIRRFDVNMVGSWEGDVGTLDEDFTYYDGETQKRIWTITKIANKNYEGTADDILGTAIGRTEGSAVRWAYEMNLPVDGTTYKIKFDDWMFLMNDDILINRSYLKKFGITVGEVTLVMQKQK